MPYSSHLPNKKKTRDRSSQKIKASKAFLMKLKQTNPELYEKIMQQVLYFLQAEKTDKKPKIVKKDLKYNLANNPELDPRQTPGPYIVRAAMDAVEPNKEIASGAKRLYGASLDAVFKDTFAKS